MYGALGDSANPIVVRTVERSMVKVANTCPLPDSTDSPLATTSARRPSSSEMTRGLLRATVFDTRPLV